MFELSALSRTALEERLDRLLAQNPSLDNKETRRIFHELQVHQIELEMQNRQLQETQTQLELAHRRYADLYDFAPVGYLTLNRQGVILEVNRRVIAWLGISRERLTRGIRLGSCIPESQRRTFALYLQNVFTSRDPPEDPSRIELTLESPGQTPRQILMESIPATSMAADTTGPACHATLSDITELKKAEQALRASEQRFRTIIETSPIPYLVTNGDGGRILLLNSAFTRTFGYHSEDVANLADWWRQACPSIALPHLRDSSGKEAAASAPHPAPLVSVEARLCCKDGGERIVWVTSTAVRGSDERLEVTSFHDVTERLRAESALREAHDTRQAILDSMTEGLMMADPNGQVVAVNPAAQRLYGFAEEQEALRSLSDYPLRFDIRNLAGEVQPPEAWPLSRACRGEVFTNHELSVRRRDTGQTFIGSYGGAPVRDAQGQVRFGITTIRDVSTQKQAEEQIRQLAFFDPLTKLANRRLLEERLNAALAQLKRRDSSLAVMVLDLDHFKPINDSLGHAAGDALLVQVAKHMRHCIRDSDTLARPGGDEFIVLLTDVTAKDAARLAEKLVACVSEPIHLMGHDLSISCSIGISLAPEDGFLASELIAHADTAMYRAKQAGRGTYHFFTADMQQDALRMLALEHQLRQALIRNELCVHYQPKIALDSGRPVGLEALARWRHPLKGLLDAHDFVPLAETCGLIDALGTWVLQAVADQIQIWKLSGLPLLPVAINLSAHQLQRNPRYQTLSSEVRDLLLTHEIPPALLELEISENSLVEQRESTLQTLQELRALGVRLTLDDFGTGYSSLSYLKAFPVDRLKIDQSFIRSLTVSNKDAAIVDTILSLGQHLRFDVIAEGVETLEQLQLLRQHGCREAQGFYFSQALSAHDTEDWLRRAA